MHTAEDTTSEPASGAETDGGTTVSSGSDETRLYTVVREAVKDALLDVIGTVVLVGIAFVFVVAGAQALLSSPSLLEATLGILFMTGGFYLAAATLEIIPPLREWL